VEARHLGRSERRHGTSHVPSGPTPIHCATYQAYNTYLLARRAERFGSVRGHRYIDPPYLGRTRQPIRALVAQLGQLFAERLGLDDLIIPPSSFRYDLL
jgi:hypothetical protein